MKKIIVENYDREDGGYIGRERFVEIQFRKKRYLLPRDTEDLIDHGHRDKVRAYRVIGKSEELSPDCAFAVEVKDKSDLEKLIRKMIAYINETFSGDY
jgi:hypothetical protein